MIDSQSNRAVTVLVVDDEDSVSGLIQALLTRNGYTVMTAATGADGLAMAEKTRPDLILMDITMPDMDGYQATARIKESPELRDVPVIFLTGKTPTEDGGRAFASGGLTFVRKPFSNRQLLDLVALTMQSVNR